MARERTSDVPPLRTAPALFNPDALAAAAIAASAAALALSPTVPPPQLSSCGSGALGASLAFPAARRHMPAAPTLLDLVRDAGCRLEESGAWPYLGGWITDDDNRKILVDALSATKEVRWFEGLLVYLTRENLSALRGAADALLRRTSEDARLALSADEVGLAVLLVGIVRQLSENPRCVGSPLLKRVKPCAACGLTMSGVGVRGEPLVERGDRPYSPDSTEPASGERLFGMLLLRSMVPPSGEAGWVLWREAACGCMILDHCYIMLHGARASFRDGRPLCPTCGNQIHPYRESYWQYGVSGTPHELFADAAPSAWDGPAAKGVLDPRDIAVVKQLLPEWMAAEVEVEETEMKSLAEGPPPPPRTPAPRLPSPEPRAPRSQEGATCRTRTVRPRRRKRRWDCCGRRPRGARL